MDACSLCVGNARAGVGPNEGPHLERIAYAFEISNTGHDNVWKHPEKRFGTVESEMRGVFDSFDGPSWPEAKLYTVHLRRYTLSIHLFVFLRTYAETSDREGECHVTALLSLYGHFPLVVIGPS